MGVGRTRRKDGPSLGTRSVGPQRGLGQGEDGRRPLSLSGEIPQGTDSAGTPTTPRRRMFPPGS